MSEKRYRSWLEVRSAMAKVIAGSDQPIPAETVQNAADLLALLKLKSTFPNGVARGYWPTITSWWTEVENTLNLEVFEDRVEVYPESPPGKVQIWYEPHDPGSAFSLRFMAVLPKVN